MQGLDKTSVNYPPVYCGIGTGMHMYLQAHPAENVDASIEISLGASTEARKWSIRVTQVKLLAISHNHRIDKNVN